MVAAFYFKFFYYTLNQKREGGAVKPSNPCQTLVKLLQFCEINFGEPIIDDSALILALGHHVCGGK